MGTLGVTFQTCLAWVTAVMTLVAGLPRLECRCPDGSTKPFCLNLTSKSTGCCCGRTCCPSTAGKKCCCCAHGTPPAAAAKSSCCGGQHSTRLTRTQPPDGKASLQGKSCVKTPVASDQLALVEGKDVSGHELVPGYGVPAGLVAVHPWLTDVRVQAAWQAYRLPPPTDLVTALGRLLI